MVYFYLFYLKIYLEQTEKHTRYNQLVSGAAVLALRRSPYKAFQRRHLALYLNTYCFNKPLADKLTRKFCNGTVLSFTAEMPVTGISWKYAAVRIRKKNCVTK